MPNPNVGFHAAFAADCAPKMDNGAIFLHDVQVQKTTPYYGDVEATLEQECTDMNDGSGTYTETACPTVRGMYTCGQSPVNFQKVPDNGTNVVFQMPSYDVGPFCYVYLYSKKDPNTGEYELLADPDLLNAWHALVTPSGQYVSSKIPPLAFDSAGDCAQKCPAAIQKAMTEGDSFGLVMQFWMNKE